MPGICIYFHAHQPYRIKKTSFFDLGNYPDFENKKANQFYLRKVINTAYLPAFHMLQDIVESSGGEFKYALSLTGSLIDQIKEDFPEVLRWISDIIKQKSLELITETFYHTIAYFYSRDEFIQQVKLQRDLLFDLFGKQMTVFRNAELAYRSDLAIQLDNIGFEGTIVEGSTRLLHNRSPNFLYCDALKDSFRLLVRNQKYSELFSNFRSPREYNIDTLAENVVNEIAELKDDLILIGFDIENLGEHHNKFTGIFKFFKKFVNESLKSGKIRFIHPSYALNYYQPLYSLEIYSPVTWHGNNKDLSAWNGNIFQKEALRYLYSIENKIKQTNNSDLIELWRKLQSTDHLLYMSSEEMINGKIADYFSPFTSVYESFLAFMNAASSLDIYAQNLLHKKAIQLFS